MTRRSGLDEVKKTAGAATLTNFKAHLRWLDGIAAAAWVAGYRPRTWHTSRRRRRRPTPGHA
ncbi:hypothetical protein FXW78_45595 [Rhodococcus opacus]|nr:hypothetical protein [Rhodococcus opacus]